MFCVLSRTFYNVLRSELYTGHYKRRPPGCIQRHSTRTCALYTTRVPRLPPGQPRGAVPDLANQADQDSPVTDLPAQSTPITARPAEVVSVRSAAGLPGDSKTGREDKQKSSLIRVNGTMERPVVVNVSAAELNKTEVLAARSAPPAHHKLKEKVKTPSSWPVVQPMPVMVAEEEPVTARHAENVVRPHDRVAPVAEQSRVVRVCYIRCR